MRRYSAIFTPLVFFTAVALSGCSDSGADSLDAGNSPGADGSGTNGSGAGADGSGTNGSGTDDGGSETSGSSSGSATNDGSGSDGGGGSPSGGENQGSGGSSSTSGGGTSSNGSGGTASSTGGTTPEGYPAGPYGENNPAIGDVIENLSLQGYRRIGDNTVVSTGDFTQFSLNDFRDSGNKYAVILVAAVWCGSCGAAADDFAAEGDALTAEGVTVIELLNQGLQSGSVPSQQEISAWATNHDLTVTTAAGINGRVLQVFRERSYFYIIDLDTMKVVDAKQQTYGDPNIAELAISAVRELL